MKLFTFFRLSVFSLGVILSAVGGEPPRNVAFLERGSIGSQGGFKGLTARELVRQAFLIALREELGWQTRDEVLGESRDGVSETFSVSLLLRGDARENTEVIGAEFLRPKKALNGPSAQGLLGTYYAGSNFEKEFQQRIDEKIFFNWGSGSPMNGLGWDRYSVRWEGFLKVPEDGEYVFVTRTDDGVRLTVDDKLLIDKWDDGEFPYNFAHALELKKGEVPIRMEYRENQVNAEAQLAWMRPKKIPATVGVTVIVRKGGARLGEPLTANLPWPGPKFYAALAETCEAWSRVEFPALLKASGLARAEKAEQKGGEYLARGLIDTALMQPDFATQFVAVRGLHALSGQPATREDALLQLGPAYAQLSTSQLRSPGGARNVFAARALLYAQRACTAKPENAAAREAQAYAYAVTDFLPLAREVLKQVKDAKPSPWGVRARALSQQNYEALKALADREDDPWSSWAAVFHGRVLLHADQNSYSNTVLNEHLEKHPGNPLLLDALTAFRGIGNLHLTTVQRPMLSRALTQMALRALPDAKELAGDPELDADGIAAQRGQLSEHGVGDAREPSLRVFQTLFEGDLFWQIGRRARFLQSELGVGQKGVKDYILQEASALKGTAYFTLLLAFTYDYKVQGNEVAVLLEPVRFWDLDYFSYSAFSSIPYFGRNVAPWVYYPGVLDSTDFTTTALAELALSNNLPQEGYLKWMMDCDPDGLWTQVTAVRYWADRKPEWFQTFTQRTDLAPRIHHEIATYFDRRGQLDQAAFWLEKLTRLRPDLLQFKKLAENHKKRGDTGKYVEIMQEALNYSDGGLGRSTILKEVAETLRAKGDYAKALEYAEASANSGAGWAMQEALNCNELVGNWERAEEYAQSIATRYENSSAGWYFLTVAYGHPNRKEALALYKAYFEKFGENLGRLDRYSRLLMNWFEGDAEAAQKDVTNLSGNPNVVDAATMAVMKGKADPAMRLKALETILGEREYDRMKPMCEAALAALRANQPLPAEKFAQVVDVSNENGWERTLACFFGGELLAQTGQREAGIQLLTKGLNCVGGEIRLRAACAHSLRALGAKAELIPKAGPAKK